MHLPSSVEPTVLKLSSAFTPRTAARVAVLIVGLILSRGRHTIAAALRAVGPLARGHFSDYHRVLSRASWSPWVLGRTVAGLVIDLFPDAARIPVATDDSVDRHRGRSSHRHTVYAYGHKWVVLAIVVQFPWTSRPWALPVLAGLYRTEKVDRAEGRRHKTPPEIARQLLATLIHWFPRKRFILLGDGGFASMDLAHSCARRGHPLVSRIRDDVALYEPAPRRRQGQRGRTRAKGRRLPSPGQRAMRKGDPEWQEATVDWYGGGQRRVVLLSGTGLWYVKGRSVMIRWVVVVDVDGTHRDDCLFSTDVTLTPEQIVGLFTRRWSLEVTFQEIRAHLGFETTRVWVKNSVLRAAPCLLGLFTLVSLAFHAHRQRHRVNPASTAWYAKDELTFSDAVAMVRRLLWRETIFGTSRANAHFSKLPTGLKTVVLDALARAA
jgi:hypothetical protein